MKIMNILTLRYLKANKKRSLLTLLCIMVSVIMMSCLGIAFSSGKDYYQSYIETISGDYHYSIDSNSQKTIDTIQNDQLVQEYYLSQTKELYYHDVSLYMRSGDTLYFQKKNMNDYIIEGRLPVNKSEIVITPTYLKMNNLNKTIGDSIEFDNHKIYTIVGLMDTYVTQDFMGNAYQALSYVDLDEQYHIYVRDKDISENIYDHVDQLKKELSNQDIMIHSSYLEALDIFKEDSQSNALNIYHMIYLFMAIISFISILIIYQAFHLSTSDRIQYLGMLSSVGATPNQKKWSVYFEGFILSIIAIPLGIIISFIGIHFAFHFINQIEYLMNLSLSVHVQISPFYLCLIIICSLLTTFIALYIPARRISKISIMDALNKTDEVKVKKNKLKLNSFSSKFLNISWQLSIKNYKRQGKKSRVIIISLMMAMILFVSVWGFSKNFINTVEQGTGIVDYDILISEIPINTSQKVESVLNNTKYDNEYYFTGSIFVNIDINSDYLTYDNSDTIGISIRALDNQHFQELCLDNHIEPSSNLALAFNQSLIINDDEEISKIYSRMDKNFIKKIYTMDYDEENDKEIEHNYQMFDDIQLIDRPHQYHFTNPYDPTLIVSQEYFEKEFQDDTVDFYVTAKEHKNLTRELQSYQWEVFDETSANQERIDFMTIVEIFIYGFVAILLLFTMLNIFNMMSASIEKRRKEFAMLMSVGMSSYDMTIMILKESLIYGIKSFVYSLPFSIVIEYLLYRLSHLSLNISINDMIFVPSWNAYFIAFVVLMIIMILTFKLGLNRFRKQNIIETLKDDM